MRDEEKIMFLQVQWNAVKTLKGEDVDLHLHETISNANLSADFFANNVNLHEYEKLKIFTLFTVEKNHVVFVLNKIFYFALRPYGGDLCLG